MCRHEEFRGCRALSVPWRILFAKSPRGPGFSKNSMRIGEPLKVCGLLPIFQLQKLYDSAQDPEHR
jgi:hypothetical protein